LRERFKNGKPLSAIADPRAGLQTSDNNRFLRFWHEVSSSKIGYGMESREAAKTSRKKWFPCTKGGGFRRWYGNNEFLVNWENDGEELFAFAGDLYGSPTRIIKNANRYFEEGLTWSSIAAVFSMRYAPTGFIFETKGSMCFPHNRTDLFPLLALSNSRVVEHILGVFSPTLDFHEGPFGRIPLPASSKWAHAGALAQEAVDLARSDWDSSERSWDFVGSPLLRSKMEAGTLQGSWTKWKEQTALVVRQLQELETENNRLFIDAYGLQEDLSPEVPEDQITVARADRREDVAAFLSYAVGCMMGRYSLDAPGLILADAGDTLAIYLQKVGKPQEQLTFSPDADGIIPVLDGEWFQDDVVARTRHFLRATFGEATLRENLRFIEESLGKDLRRY
jgi:hypothetical protein